MLVKDVNAECRRMKRSPTSLQSLYLFAKIMKNNKNKKTITTLCLIYAFQGPEQFRIGNVC